MVTRPSWDKYFMNVAKMVSSRGTCPRLRVGAILVRDKRIIATGYNGSIKGQPHCDNKSCLMIDPKSKNLEPNNRCVRTIHAELNVLSQCAKYGLSSDKTTLYITHIPCDLCMKSLINSGIQRIVFENDRDKPHYNLAKKWAKLSKLKLKRLKNGNIQNKRGSKTS